MSKCKWIVAVLGGLCVAGLQVACNDGHILDGDVTCTVCKVEYNKGDYDKVCCKIHGEEGVVRCSCGAMVSAGTYCKGCNRIVLEGTKKCCGQEMPKGSYCSACRVYVGAKKVKYCEGCKSPYGSSGCMCKKT